MRKRSEREKKMSFQVLFGFQEFNKKIIFWMIHDVLKISKFTIRKNRNNVSI